MSVCLSSGRTVRRVLVTCDSRIAELPAFLCPRLFNLPQLHVQSTRTRQTRQTLPASRRFISTEAKDVLPVPAQVPASVLKKLPRQCPGCGAHTQFVDKEEAGFYTTTRKTIKEFLGTTPIKDNSAEDAIVQAALKNAGGAAQGLSFGLGTHHTKSTEPPFCDRCHDIIHHSNGVSIHHPTASAIQETILESPHTHNHIYHIIDAADFPMSLVPQLQKILNATPQRSHNRRSKTDRYYHGRKIDMSFIITRSDLLAATKEQVDALMPYLRETLRDALGRSAREMRLGNVKCVSAKRQWWTSVLKEDIYKRGGGNWMVGKVNVGKSQLLHEIFPKGRREIGTSNKGYKAITLEERGNIVAVAEEEGKDTLEQIGKAEKDAVLDSVVPLSNLGDTGATTAEFLDSSSLLPPAPPEVNYPAMPLVSSLPGTTASPIRLPFGNGKGEMIDLPGLSRGDLELYVQPEHRPSLVMRSRITPKQNTLKPGQSLLLGGFIRITPTSPVEILSYNFTPLEEHRTSTVKAIEIQAQSEEAKNVPVIALPEAASQTKLAGTFHLKWDVTKERAGPLTHKKKVGLKPEKLPFKVLATDLLIEGVGWVELVAQVRNRRSDAPSPLDREIKNEDVLLIEPQKPVNAKESSTRKQGRDDEGTSLAVETAHYTPLWSSSPSDDTLPAAAPEIPAEEEHTLGIVSQKSAPHPVSSEWPSFEVYTPEGKFVATRRPMNAWLNVLSKPKKPGVRPRKSMKGAKKAEKKRRRGW